MKAKLEVYFYLRKTKATTTSARLGAFLLAFLALTVFPAFLPAAQAGGKEIVLLHTNNVTGHLFPCPT